MGFWLIGVAAEDEALPPFGRSAARGAADVPDDDFALKIVAGGEPAELGVEAVLEAVVADFVPRKR